MAENTGISWTDATFNPWIGCTKVSPGCDNCYAERDWDLRKHRVVWGAGQARSRTKTWGDPVKWNNQRFFQCTRCGWRGTLRGVVREPMRMAFYSHDCGGDLVDARMRVFCASLADVFDNEVDPQWRADLFELIKSTPSLDWLLLTKRIGNVPAMVAIIPGWLPENVWLGATIVNQAEADRDIPKLLATPARVRFLSCEPLLGPVDLTEIRLPLAGDSYTQGNVLVHKSALNKGHPRPAIDWVIVGGESGAKARDFDIGWPRSIVAQCKAAGVPVHVKQMGAKPVWSEVDDGIAEPPFWGRIKFVDKSGGDASEWPADLRVQEFPNA